jgi:hypothetical protein
MPVVESIDELNAMLAAADDADDARRISYRTTSVGHDWAFEKTLLRPLPTDAFDTALTLTPRIDRTRKSWCAAINTACRPALLVIGCG